MAVLRVAARGEVVEEGGDAVPEEAERLVAVADGAENLPEEFFSRISPALISSGDWRPLRAPALCPLALTGTPPEPLSLGQPLPF